MTRRLTDKRELKIRYATFPRASRNNHSCINHQATDVMHWVVTFKSIASNVINSLSNERSAKFPGQSDEKIELVIENAVPTANVNADREAIHQIFSNLIENALKYAASGKRVILGARAAASGVEFYVRDFGPGISSEHLHRLFERFYRVDKARSRESGGTGLGLAIAKHIVLAHEGTIRAESELNHGSTFLFTLPASEADSA